MNHGPNRSRSEKGEKKDFGVILSTKRMEPPLNPDIPAQRERLRRLFQMKRVEGEMLAQRGYLLNEVYMMRFNRPFEPVDLTRLQNPTLGMSENLDEPTPSHDSAYFLAMLQFRQETGLFQSRQEFSSIYLTPDRTQQIVVLYLGNEPGKQVAKKDFDIVNVFIETQRYRNIIIVTETGLNPENTNKVLNRTTGYKIEVFPDSELAFPRIKHGYCPINIRYIPGTDVQRWSQEEQIQAEKLPMMINIDTVGKWYGANPFDVFQCEILGTTTDTTESSRIVRQAPAKQ